MKPVTAARIKVATDAGIQNADVAAVACREADLPFYVACALLEKESGGANVFGHDVGGALAGAGEVTKAKWQKFRHLVIDQGHTSNGVGPCQITWRGFFPDMEKQGLKPWDVHDNMLYGFELLRHHYEVGGSWEAAGTAYNGSPTYGHDLALKVAKWRSRLGIK